MPEKLSPRKILFYDDCDNKNQQLTNQKAEINEISQVDITDHSSAAIDSNLANQNKVQNESASDDNITQISNKESPISSKSEIQVNLNSENAESVKLSEIESTDRSSQNSEKSFKRFRK